MRKSIAMLLAAPMALISLSSPALASEGRGQPFITVAHYKKNISLAEFRVSPRNFFRSEDAYRLIVRYTSDEVGRQMSAAEFDALMRDDNQTRVRDLRPDEKINTGAYLVGGFDWFDRLSRPGEQIVQLRVNGVWKDMFSLNCLNAVEDKTPAPPPVLTYVPPAPPIVPQPVQMRSSMSAASEPSFGNNTMVGVIYFPTYRGGSHTINAGSRSASSSSSSSTSGTPGCTTACGGHAPVQPGHIQGN